MRTNEIIHVPIDAEMEKWAKLEASRKCVGGYSDVYRTHLKGKALMQANLIGVIGEISLNSACGMTAELKLWLDWVAKHCKDGGIDIPGYRIDIKTRDYKEVCPDLLSYKMIVMRKDRRDNWIYALAIADWERRVVHLIGTAETRRLKQGYFHEGKLDMDKWCISGYQLTPFKRLPDGRIDLRGYPPYRGKDGKTDFADFMRRMARSDGERDPDPDLHFVQDAFPLD